MYVASKHLESHLPGLPSITVTGGLVSYRIRGNASRKPKISTKALLLSSSALIAVLAAASAANAQGVTALEGITIYSANRTPTEAAKVGSSVEVLTEKDLEKQSRTYVKDYLEQLPGVSFAQSGPPGSTTRINIRGAGPQYVKVLVDGMDVSDPSQPQTGTAFEHLLVGDVSRIEVLKGSQSTLYGGDAVGGVINIETKTATKPGFSQRGGAEGGQYNTFSGAYTTGYAAADGSNIAFTVQGVDTDGFSAASVGTEDDGYQNLTFSGRGEYHISPAMKLFFAARTVEADHDYDGYLSVPPYTFGDAAEAGKYSQQAGRVGTEFTLLNGAFVNTFALQGMRLERDSFVSGVRNRWYDADRVKAEYKGVLTFNDQLSLLVGADWEEQGAENNTMGGNRTAADVTGVFTQLMMEPIDGLVLTAGGRIDEHSDFGQFNTYRLTGAYLLPGTETKLRGTVGTGFRAPSLFELFDPYYGNPTLQPEESKSWDVGIEQGLLNGRVKLGATYFELDTDNLIQYTCGFPEIPPCYVNVPGVTHREGVELTATALVTDGVAITAGYTYVEAKEADGDPLIRVPKHTFVVGVDLQPTDKVELNVTGKYVADTLDSQFPGTVALDDYFLLSAKASYEFTPGWKAYVRGENLLDEEYETLLGFGTAGASVYGGLTMALPSD